MCSNSSAVIAGITRTLPIIYGIPCQARNGGKGQNTFKYNLKQKGIIIYANGQQDI